MIGAVINYLLPSIVNFHAAFLSALFIDFINKVVIKMEIYYGRCLLESYHNQFGCYRNRGGCIRIGGIAVEK
jgi:hypothetical protein